MFKNFGKDLLKAFNTGVSYFIPVVVVGGVFYAFSLLGATADSTSGMVATNPFMLNLQAIGNSGLKVMIPVLAAYIAYSFGGKPALAPGFVLGYLANNMADSGITSTGFLGAMFLGVAVGYWVKWMKTWKVSKTIHTIMPILVMPILTTFVFGLLYIYILALPLGMFMNWLTVILGNLQGGSAAVLGIVIGLMTAFDMGGPVNKAASTFTMALMTTTPALYIPNGAFRVAVAIPPLACGIASFIARNKYDDADRQIGISAIFMGLIGITEGAIPFAVKDLPHTLPGIMIGSAVGACLAMVQGVECYVPHGGMIVAFATNNIGLYTLDMAIGTFVAVFILIIMKPNLKKNSDPKIAERAAA
jgi:PTS system fructose-specific IIC component